MTLHYEHDRYILNDKNKLTLNAVLSTTRGERGVSMTPLEVWEKYKHLDANLSDRELIPESFWGSIIFDLWAAIKYTIQEGKG